MFVENVLTEVKGKATLVAMDQTGSITLQRLLPLSSLQQVGEVLAELGGESGSEFKAVSCDRCGGHVVESAVRQMSRLSGEGIVFYEVYWNHTNQNQLTCVPVRLQRHLVLKGRKKRRRRKRRVQSRWRLRSCL